MEAVAVQATGRTLKIVLTPRLDLVLKTAASVTGYSEQTSIEEALVRLLLHRAQILMNVMNHDWLQLKDDPAPHQLEAIKTALLGMGREIRWNEETRQPEWRFKGEWQQWLPI
jgi:hypothetical protein